MTAMLETNQPAPDFTAINQNGDDISLAQYRGGASRLGVDPRTLP